LFSANVRKPFGYVEKANAGLLVFGGALWSLDSDFDCRGVSPGETYSITDHCGEAKLLVDTIDPHYLAMQIRQAGLAIGFTRDFRPSLSVIRDLEINLPVDLCGRFDLALMQSWTKFYEELLQRKEALAKLLAQ
jgi:type I restriction enzyme M protein